MTRTPRTAHTGRPSRSPRPRQQAIAAALAGHRRVLEDIEVAYRRDVAAARCRYGQRIIEPAQTTRLASVMTDTQRPDAALPRSA